MVFTEQTGTNGTLPNPFAGIDVGIYSTPSLLDFDGDGDLDAAVGLGDGTIKYFQNIGTTSNPSFVEQTGTNNPFTSIDVGTLSAPSLADLNADNRIDLVVGAASGSLRYFHNTGSGFVSSTIGNVGLSGYSTPTLGDVDGDGDKDLVAGAGDGKFYYFKNIGSTSNPIFVQQTGSNNPFANFDVGNYSAPSLVDIDQDGDADLVSGAEDGKLYFFKSFLKELGAPALFLARTNTQNPFNGIDVGSSSTPSFADLNSDGQPDLIVGDATGKLRYFVEVSVTSAQATSLNSSILKNSNSPKDGKQPTPTSNLGEGVNVGSTADGLLNSTPGQAPTQVVSDIQGLVLPLTPENAPILVEAMPMPAIAATQAASSLPHPADPFRSSTSDPSAHAAQLLHLPVIPPIF